MDGQLRGQNSGCVSMGVGVAFDMHGGIIQRAPKFCGSQASSFVSNCAGAESSAGRYCSDPALYFRSRIRATGLCVAY